MYQFRLSTLMIVVTMLAVFFAVPGMFGLSPVPWIVGWTCFGLSLWFWKFVLCTEISLSGASAGNASWRLMVGTIAGGALFGNALLLFAVITSAPNNLETLYWIPALVFIGSAIGTILAGIAVFFVGLLVSLLFISLENPKGRAFCPAMAGAAVGVGWMIYFFLGNDFSPGIDGFFTTLTAAGFGAVGGGMPEILKTRYDKRIAARTENTVPRETVVEVD
jgi:hypothetical protein